MGPGTCAWGHIPRFRPLPAKRQASFSLAKPGALGTERHGWCVFMRSLRREDNVLVMELKPRKRWEFCPGASERFLLEAGVWVLLPDLPVFTASTQGRPGDPTKSQGRAAQAPRRWSWVPASPASAPRPACPGPGGHPAARPSALECGPPSCLFLRGCAAGGSLLQFGILCPELLKTKTQNEGAEGHK